MPSTCPKCHQVLEEDYVCCADVTYTWKCTQCRKLSKGFVIPFGRCEVCGGALEIVDDSAYRDVARLRPIQQALQAEMNAYTFYSMLAAEATDPDVRALFASLSEMERGHLENLAEKYRGAGDLPRTGRRGGRAHRPPGVGPGQDQGGLGPLNPPPGASDGGASSGATT